MAIEHWERLAARTSPSAVVRRWTVLEGGGAQDPVPATPRRLPPSTAQRTVLVGTCSFKVL